MDQVLSLSAAKNGFRFLYPMRLLGNKENLEFPVNSCHLSLGACHFSVIN
jgi:hypothetical protein